MIAGMILVNKWPWLTHIPNEMTNKINESMRLMRSEAQKMLDSRKKAAEAGELEDKNDVCLDLFYFAALANDVQARIHSLQVQQTVYESEGPLYR